MSKYVHIYVIIFGKIWTIKLKSIKICTVFEINDGVTLDDGKLKVLESGSHEYVVVTCAVSFEFKSRD